MRSSASPGASTSWLRRCAAQGVRPTATALLVALPALLLAGLGACGGDGETGAAGRHGDAGTHAPDLQLDNADGGAHGRDGGAERDAAPAPDAAPPLQGRCGVFRLNEAMARNEGAWIDEVGETDDWIEVLNTGDEAASLRGCLIADRGGEPVELPELVVPAQGVVLLWPDKEPEQGPGHLPFGLSSSGDRVVLSEADGTAVDELEVPAGLAPNVAIARIPDGDGAWQACVWPTAGRHNGDTCGPPPPPEIEDDLEFAPYPWPEPWPEPPSAAINEVAFGPGGFVEVVNNSVRARPSANLVLTLTALHPGQHWPEAMHGLALDTGDVELASGEVLRVELPDAQAAAELARGPDWVVTLWEQDRLLDRVDGVGWPSDPASVALARQPHAWGHHLFCQRGSPGQPNPACDVLPSRPVGSYLRHLRTPGDYDAMTGDPLQVGFDEVKLTLDLLHGDQVFVANTAHWDLHYTFVREVIEGNPPLDRCDPAEAAVFDAGRQAFDDENYYGTEGRRFLLMTLMHWGANDLYTLNFRSAKDQMRAEQVLHGFFQSMRHVYDHRRWFFLPERRRQEPLARQLDGQLPIVGPNAPLRGVRYQPLNEVVGYGVLRFVPAAELEQAVLGPQVILVTDQVPNDIPLTGGVITENFQTPLSHVNVLSRNRGTPNMALVDARNDPGVQPWFDQLVRLEVGSGGFEIRAAPAEEANAFWERRRADGPLQVPAIDLSRRGVVDLAQVDASATPQIGAKAAQLAELMRMQPQGPGCPAAMPTPQSGFAIPVVHYVEHAERSGATARLRELERDAEFLADPAYRAERLAEVRALVQAAVVDGELLADVRATMRERFGTDRVRFRSSSNTEDLAGFSGAGLYTSLSAAVDDPERPIEDALRTVWASLWSPRAWEERDFFRVDQSAVAMGVLCHRAFLSERANGVALSLDPNLPSSPSRNYINVQLGEASVTNPAPGITSDQFVHWPWPSERYVAYSSFNGGVPILSRPEIDTLHCVLESIEGHFRTLLDPEGSNPWFTMEIEFKLLGAERRLLVKQARPYSYGAVVIPETCQ